MDINIYDSMFSGEHFSEALSDVFEKELNSCVEFGRPERLEAIFSRMKSDTKSIPEVADNAISSFRNICIFSTGVVSRVALKGGLDYDTVTSMCTYYLKQFEVLDTYQLLFEKFKGMFLAFARKTANCRYMLNTTPLVYRITKTITSNLYEKITPSIIADILRMNVSYLCRHFKTHTGKTITTFINEVKVTEAKRLLKYSDITVIQISTQLGFSSQNYFHTVFKKASGMTPLEYRNNALRAG